MLLLLPAASPVYSTLSKAITENSLDRALVGGLDVDRRRAVHEHARDLHLAVGVERDEADVGLGEGLGRRLDLLEDLRRVGAAEHGQLVHRPVAVVLVADRVADADGVGVGDVSLARVGELEGRDPAVAGDVVDLLGDLGVRERGQVGEGLEEPFLRRRRRSGGGGGGGGGRCKVSEKDKLGEKGVTGKKDRAAGGGGLFNTKRRAARTILRRKMKWAFSARSSATCAALAASKLRR